MQELAQEKEKLVDHKLKTIGNYVHDSVPESDNEVWGIRRAVERLVLIGVKGQQCSNTDMGA